MELKLTSPYKGSEFCFRKLCMVSNETPTKEGQTMPTNDELFSMRQSALAQPGTAILSADGRTLMISFDGVETFQYSGPDFNTMTLKEINAFFARFDQN